MSSGIASILVALLTFIGESFKSTSGRSPEEARSQRRATLATVLIVGLGIVTVLGYQFYTTELANAEATRSEKAVLQKDMDLLKSEIVALKAKNSALEKRRAEDDVRIARAEQREAELKRQLDDKERTIATLTIEQKDLENQLVVRAATITKLSKDLAFANRRVSEEEAEDTRLWDVLVVDPGGGGG